MVIQLLAPLLSGWATENLVNRIWRLHRYSLRTVTGVFPLERTNQLEAKTHHSRTHGLRHIVRPRMRYS
jgi:hypothetical protein